MDSFAEDIFSNMSFGALSASEWGAISTPMKPGLVSLTKSLPFPLANAEEALQRTKSARLMFLKVFMGFPSKKIVNDSFLNRVSKFFVNPRKTEFRRSCAKIFFLTEHRMSR